MTALWKTAQTWEGWHDGNPGSPHISPEDLWSTVVHTIDQCYLVLQRRMHLRVHGSDTSPPIRLDGP